MHLVVSLLVFKGRMWDLIVSVPDRCLSFYFVFKLFVLRSALDDLFFFFFFLNVANHC